MHGGRDEAEMWRIPLPSCTSNWAASRRNETTTKSADQLFSVLQTGQDDFKSCHRKVSVAPLVGTINMTDK